MHIWIIIIAPNRITHKELDGPCLSLEQIPPVEHPNKLRSQLSGCIFCCSIQLLRIPQFPVLRHPSNGEEERTKADSRAAGSGRPTWRARGSQFALAQWHCFGSSASPFAVPSPPRRLQDKVPHDWIGMPVKGEKVARPTVSSSRSVRQLTLTASPFRARHSRTNGQSDSSRRAHPAGCTGSRALGSYQWTPHNLLIARIARITQFVVRVAEARVHGASVYLSIFIATSIRQHSGGGLLHLPLPSLRINCEMPFWITN